MIVHHYGFLTKDIERSIAKFKCLGYEIICEILDDLERGVKLAFLKSENGHLIELVSPNTDNSVVKNIFKKYQNTIYHICYEVENIDHSIKELEKNSYILIDAPKPALAFKYKKVAFMFSNNSGIIELLEK